MRDWILTDENCSSKSAMVGIAVGLLVAFVFPFPFIMSVAITALAFANATEILYWWFRWRRRAEDRIAKEQSSK